MTGLHRVAIAVMLAVFLVGAHVGHVQAHAILIQSTPADGSLDSCRPHTVRLVFSEPVQPIGGGIIVVAPSGKQVQRGRVQRAAEILSVAVDIGETGSYLVLWQVVSGDTHPARGRFVFSVGRRSPTADVGAGSSVGLALQVLARWIHAIGFALGLGPFVFFLFVARRHPVARRARIEATLWTLVTIGVVLLLVAEPLAFLAETASLDATGFFSPDLAVGVLALSFGRVVAQQLAAALLLWAVLGMVKQDASRFAWIGLIPGVALAFIDGEGSHAISSSPAWLGMMSNTIHICAMGTWIGGLAALLAVVRSPHTEGSRGDMVRRFGIIAEGCMIALVLTGTVMAWQHLRGPHDLMGTAYGETLSIKIVLVAGVGAVVLAGQRGIIPYPELWWKWELVTLSGVLAAAALLASLPPAT